MTARRILHYEIDQELGSGAMGRVYRARDTRSERLVALKFLSIGGPEAATREMVLREARAAARLHHPGIVTLYSVEEADGEAFLVQQLIEGETLADRLRRGPMDAPEVRRLARELAAALAHAHQNGVLHRDLKPSNILVARDGSFKVADFGIARLDDTTVGTGTTSLLGTLPYMAPERIEGHPGDIRSDLFAVGAILYEALSGRRAFEAENQAHLLNALLNHDPPPLAVGGSGDLVLTALVGRLLQKDPERRPASAERLLELLESPEAPRPVAPAAPADGAGRRPGAKPWPWLAAGLALAVLLALVLRFKGPAGAPVVDAAGGSIAVLDFSNLADASDPERLGAIAGNLLVTALAQRDDLSVLSPQSVLDALHRELGSAAPGTAESSLRVARKLGARRLVTGSILQSSPTIVVTAELTEVGSGRIVHAARIEGAPGESVFQVVDQLTAQLAPRLSPEMGDSRLEPVARRSSDDLDAVRSYVVGLDLLSQGDIPGARRLFRDAISRDPGFPQAHYQLALVEWWQNEGGPPEEIRRAREHAGRLTGFERRMLDGLTLLTSAHYDSAAIVFDELARSYPQDKMVQYGRVESQFHRFDLEMTIEAGRRALAIDPNFTLASIHLLDALAIRGQFAEAESTARALLVTSPRNAMLRRALVEGAALRGDRREFLRQAWLARADGLPPDVLLSVPTLYVALDSLEEARRWLVGLPGTPAWLELDRRFTLDYTQALNDGQFRRAGRIAETAWTGVDSWPPDVRYRLTAANGVAAGLARGDREFALRSLDRLMAALRIALPHVGDAFDLGRAPILAAFGDTAGALALCRRIGRGPEAGAAVPGSSGSDPSPSAGQARSVEVLLAPIRTMARAMALDLEGNPAEAFRVSEGGALPMSSERSVQLQYGRFTRIGFALRAGLFAEAVALADTVIQFPTIDPQDTMRARLHRGLALEKLGRRQEAGEQFREILSRWRGADAGTAEVREARAGLERLGLRS